MGTLDGAASRVIENRETSEIPTVLQQAMSVVIVLAEPPTVQVATLGHVKLERRCPPLMFLIPARDQFYA